ncbi:MAG: hypothetical protein WC880_00540 [Candidatus Paceibacterota bacterium]
MEKQEVYKKAVSRLSSLKANLDNAMIHEKFVREYHLILDSLTTSGVSIEEFKIPESELKQGWISSNYMTGEVQYADYKEVEKEYFLYKLDSIINYLKME